MALASGVVFDCWPGGVLLDPAQADDALIVRMVRDVFQDPVLRRLAGRRLRFLAQCAIHDPQNRELVSMFLANVQRLRLRAANASIDEFAMNTPRRGSFSSARGIPLIILATGDILRLLPGHLCTGITVTAPTGGCKSSYIAWIICAIMTLFPNTVIIVLDRKKVLRSLVAMLPPGMVTVFRRIGKVPLVLCGHNNSHVPHKNVAFADCELMGAAAGKVNSHRFLNAVVRKHLRPGRGFSLRLLYERAMAYSTKGGWHANSSREPALRTLEFFLEYMEDTYAYTYSTFCDELFSRPGVYVFETDTLPSALASFLTIHIEQYCYSSRLHAPPEPGRPTVICVLDDFTPALSSMTYGGGSPLVNFMEMSRQLDIGHILGFHALSIAGTRLLQNTETKVVLNARAEDGSLMMRLFGMTPEQFHRARVLQRGEAVVLAPSSFPEVLRGHFPHVVLPEVPDAHCDATMERFLALVKTESDHGALAAITTGDQGTGLGEKRMSAEEAAGILHVLRQFADFPIFSLTEHFGALKLTRIRGMRLVKDYEARGYVTRHTVSSVKRDGVIIQVLESGRQFLHERGHDVKLTKKARGGYLHDAALFAWTLLNNDGRMRYEVGREDIRVDALMTNDRGDTTVVQVALSDAQREAEVLADAMRTVPLVRNSHVLIFAREASFANAFRSHLQRFVSEDDCRRVEVRLLGDLLREARRRCAPPAEGIGDGRGKREA